MALFGEYMKRVMAVNEAQDEASHTVAQLKFIGFCEGLRIMGADMGYLIMAADNHYLSQGIKRPMCGGEFLDWKPAEST